MELNLGRIVRKFTANATDESGGENLEMVKKKKKIDSSIYISYDLDKPSTGRIFA